MKPLLLCALLALSISSFSQSNINLTPYTIEQDDVTLTLMLSPSQKVVESDSGSVIYGNKFEFQVKVKGIIPSKLIVSGVACKVTLVSKAEGRYKLTTTTHIMKRKVSVNFGARPVIFELWIHPDL